jgi:RNA polymerase sigma-70 factor (ECF subfamily)
MRFTVSQATAPVTTIGDKAAALEAPACADICERLRITLRDLQPEAKVVFLLRQNSGLTYEEIARILRCPVGTVKTRMRFAVRELRDVLNQK